ncbi:MAG: hypothetical protein ACLRTA_00400 [Clostridia bacterium]
MQRLDPDMPGIGPFLSHKDTPFAVQNGDYRLCLRAAVVRHVFADALIPLRQRLGLLILAGGSPDLRQS